MDLFSGGHVQRPSMGQRQAKIRYFYWWAGGHKCWECFEGGHGSWKFENHCSKWYWQVLLADPAIRRRTTGQFPPDIFENMLSWIYQLGASLLAKWNEVMICGFVENHDNPMLLSSQIIAVLPWKVMPCVENLQIAYCVNCRNTNIPGYCCQRSVFCDCYRNTGHFLCSVERIKCFVNDHLHCIVSNVPFWCANSQDHQKCCAVASHSRALATF